MITYRIIQSKLDEWIVERREPGQPPKLIWGGFKSAEQAQAHADDLAAHESPERAMH